MTSSNKDRSSFYPTVGKSRRSSPGDSQTGHGFFSTGQGLSSSCNIVDAFAQRAASLCAVPASYSNPYTQPRSAAANKLGGYDLGSPLYGAYQQTNASPQFPTSFPNYEMHHAERYSPQPYPTYPRSTPPIITNPTDSRRLPPLSTSPPPSERWSHTTFPQQPVGFPHNNIRSPTATYPNQYLQYTSNHSDNYPYHLPQDHVVPMNNQHAIFNEMHRLEPRTSSPYNRVGTSHFAPPPPPSPPPLSPTSPEEPTIKKKRKRADATQLKVLNETYARTAFPSTEERIALAKMLDMSARSVQIWFQNKRQSMRQTNRQSGSASSSSHHPYSISNQVEPVSDDLVPHHSSYDTGSGSLNDTLYLTSSSHDPSRTHGPHYHHPSSHRHRD